MGGVGGGMGRGDGVTWVDWVSLDILECTWMYFDIIRYVLFVCSDCFTLTYTFEFS